MAIEPLTTPQLGRLAEHLSVELIMPGHPDYDEARRVWNGMIDRRPAALARCADAGDVAAALGFARDHGLPVAVRGGGHNVAGTGVCDDGLVIDLSPMRSVRIDDAAGTVHVGGGATWGDVDRITGPRGLATPGGVISETGVAGLALSGGVSSQRRAHGMTVDNLVSADVVLADGRLVRAAPDEHPDLFWALRGGGGNFGVVTSFEFRLHELGPEVFSVDVYYDLEDAARVFAAWRDAVAGAPDQLTCDAIMWTLPVIPDLPEPLRGRPFAGVTGMWAGDPEEGERRTRHLRELATPMLDMSGTVDYVELQSSLDPLFPRGLRYYWKALYLDDLPDAAIDAMVGRFATRPSERALVIVRHGGGEIGRVSPEATAFGDRSAEFMLSIDSMWTDSVDDAANIAWTREFWDDAHRFSAQGKTYFNFPGFLEENEQLVRDSYGANHERLRRIKGVYDPDNVFRLNQNITPARA